MAQYDNTNTGILKVNDKGDNPNRPDRTGSINIDGKEYWLSGWIKKVDNPNSKLDGQTILRLRVRPKEEEENKREREESPRREERHTARTREPEPEPQHTDDDIPF